MRIKSPLANITEVLDQIEILLNSITILFE